jgi:chromosome partitioning protein
LLLTIALFDSKLANKQNSLLFYKFTISQFCKGCDMGAMVEMSEPEVIAMAHQKGGTGKSTLIENLAVEAEKDGYKTLVIDLDAQATAESWADRRTDDWPIVISAHPPRLPQVIQTAKEMGVDLIFIDTPGKSESAALAAAKVAHLVIIPCRPQINDVETLDATLELLSLAKNNPARFAVLNACPAKGTRHIDARLAIEEKGIVVCPTHIIQRNSYGDAPVDGKAVTEFDPKGKAAEEIKLVYNFTIEQLNKATSGGVNGKSIQHSRRAQAVG